MFRKLPQYELAEAFEQYLGDPLDPERPLSFRQAVELDEREEYPEAACAEIERWGFHEQYAPERYGGRFRSFEELFALLRAIARRDVTVAVAHAKTYLGAVGVWSMGSRRQKENLARIIKAGGQVAFALTEKDHGSDLLATEVTATKVEGGYILSGEKWLISNVRRCAALTLFARTEPAGGPRGFSLFFIEKSALDQSSFKYLPRVKTHGVRGADIAGVRFENCLVPNWALVGPPGSALETTLKCFQVTRTLIPAISLGAGDTALRSVMRFALSRRLYGEVVFAIPEARRVLVDAFLDLLICDCVAVAAARSLHVAPGRMSVWSAVAKYFTPVRVERVIGDLAVALGARYFLREGHDYGVFQKALRDNSILSLFDGSTVINLNGIVQQLQQIWRGRYITGAREMDSCLRRIFSLLEPLPDFDPDELEMTNRGRDDITQSLPIFSLPRLKELFSIDLPIREDLAGLLDELIQESDEQRRELLSLTSRPGNAFNNSPELFDLARRHCALHAAASCLWMWLFNRECLGDFFARGEWLVLCLNRLLMDLQPRRRVFLAAHYQSVAQYLLELQRNDRQFSILPLKLAGREESREPYELFG